MKKVKILFAFILGLAIGLTSVAFAADTIQAVISKSKLTVNCQEIPLERPIIIYDGAAYIPVQETLSKLGYTVTWDEQQGILNLQKPVTYIIGADGKPVMVDDELLRKIIDAATSETAATP